MFSVILLRVLYLTTLILAGRQLCTANSGVDRDFNGADLNWCKMIPEGTVPECSGKAAATTSAPPSTAVPSTSGASNPSTTPTPDLALTTAPGEPSLADLDPQFNFIGTERLPAEQVMMTSKSFEGDILGYDPVLMKSTEQLQQQSKNFITDDSRKWPRGVVPFKLSSYFRPLETAKVREALESFTGKTGVQFKERSSEADYLYIGPGVGCQSYTGRQGGEQLLSLQMPECKDAGLIHHELMHVVGFYHEQSRTDRDKYVEINWDNIGQENLGQFQKYSAEEMTAFGEEYDFRSLMHYGQFYFALKTGVFTIRPKADKLPPGMSVQEMGQRDGLSAIDLTKIKLAYPKFDSKCPTEEGWMQVGEKKCYYFSFIAKKKVFRFAEGRNYCRLRSAAPASEQPNSMRFVHGVMEEHKDVLESGQRVWIANCKTITRGSPNAMDAECVTSTPQYFICYKRITVEDA
ncbi:zinc metalloproteinase nas-6-like [Paramacrobiotus metropolitanus]|uniref:zinc metalloproteinase nas-6-like n=1 Tax=Paramacrobiotus metropolitanus TaxID=2943436 RepID=UPI002445A444|nr:zinc metalloproteinase nas-6-like [Paramacrobiotus metropolitanus]